MSKPLARYKNDADLDQMLKERERAEDPMLAFMQKKKAKQNVIAGKKGNTSGGFLPQVYLLFD
jgi:pre-mRNA-splicing factor CWC26